MKKTNIIIAIFIVLITSVIITIVIKKQNNSFSEIIIEQKEIDKIIKKEIKNKNNTLENPKIIINPYKISPLTALIIFNTEKSENFELIINSENCGTTMEERQHSIPIYGLLSDYKNEIILKNNNKEYKYYIETEKVKYDNMIIDTKKNVEDSELYFLIGGENPNSIAYDKNGNIRWFFDVVLTTDIEFLDNGHLLIGNGDGNAFEGFTGLYEIDYLGKIYKEYKLEGGTHHSFSVLPNGNYLISTGNTDDISWDHIIELNPKTGKTVKKIDILNILRKIDKNFYKNNNSSIYNNSNYYDKETNTLTISLRTLNSIININYDTLELNWIYGTDENLSNLKKYILKNNSQINTYGQHSVFFNNGILGLFDNHTIDIYSIDCKKIDDLYSQAILFKINDNEYDIELKFYDNEKNLSPYLSSFTKLENGNYLVNYGYIIDKEQFKKVKCNFDYYIEEPTTIIYEIDKNNDIIFKGTLNKQSKQFAYKNKFYKNKIQNFLIEKYNVYSNGDL